MFRTPLLPNKFSKFRAYLPFTVRGWFGTIALHHFLLCLLGLFRDTRITACAIQARIKPSYPLNGSSETCSLDSLAHFPRSLSRRRIMNTGGSLRTKKLTFPFPMRRRAAKARREVLVSLIAAAELKHTLYVRYINSRNRIYTCLSQN